MEIDAKRDGEDKHRCKDRQWQMGIGAIIDSAR